MVLGLEMERGKVDLPGPGAHLLVCIRELDLSDGEGDGRFDWPWRCPALVPGGYWSRWYIGRVPLSALEREKFQRSPFRLQGRSSSWRFWSSGW